MRLLATTTRGLESVSADEIAELTGARVGTAWPGAVEFEGDESDVYRLNCRAGTVNRVLVALASGGVGSLSDVYDLARGARAPAYVGVDQPFAVRATRRGDHEFTSVDVADRVGQAIIDAVRDAEGERPPVDLDDPEVIFRAFVRDDRAWLSVDTTGEESLHRRWYRVVEHDAPIRPTMAAALLRLAGAGPDTSVVDPMCGCGTIPIEAALAARDRPIAPRREPALVDLPFLDADRFRELRAGREPRPQCPRVRGIEMEKRWVRGARRNAREAGVADDVRFERGDATEATLEEDAVVVNMPFGIHTPGGNLAALYRDFFDNLRDGDWGRMVALTARDDLVPVDPTERLDVRFGRLDVSVLVVER